MSAAKDVLGALERAAEWHESYTGDFTGEGVVTHESDAAALRELTDALKTPEGLDDPSPAGYAADVLDACSESALDTELMLAVSAWCGRLSRLLQPEKEA